MFKVNNRHQNDATGDAIQETMLKIIKTLGQNEAHRHGGASIWMIKICKLSIDKPLSSYLIIP